MTQHLIALEGANAKSPMQIAALCAIQQCLVCRLVPVLLQFVCSVLAVQLQLSLQFRFSVVFVSVCLPISQLCSKVNKLQVF